MLNLVYTHHCHSYFKLKHLLTFLWAWQCVFSYPCSYSFDFLEYHDLATRLLTSQAILLNSIQSQGNLGSCLQGDWGLACPSQVGDATKPFFHHSGNEQKDHKWDIFSEYIWKPLQQAPAYENIPPFDELSVTNEDSIKAIKKKKNIYIYIYIYIYTLLSLLLVLLLTPKERQNNI